MKGVAVSAGRWSDDDIEDLLDGGDGEGESSAIKDIRSALRAMTRRAKEAETKVAQFETGNRQKTINDLLKARELPEKVANLIPDSVKDEAGLTTWLDDYSEVFGTPKSAKSDGGNPAETNLTPENIGALRQIDVMTQGAGTAASVNDMMAQIKNAGSAEDLIRLIESQGGGVGR